MLPIELERVLDQGDVAGCVVLFANATERERSSMAKIAVPRLKKQLGGILGRLLDRFGALPEHDESLLSQFELAKREQIVATQVAVLACAPLGQLKKLGVRAVPPADEAYAVLVARRPPWIDEWAEFICNLSAFCWPVVRRLVREGICKRPDGDGYIEGMLSIGRGFHSRGPIIEALLEDPELLEHEIWRIFELEPKRHTRDLLSAREGTRPEYSWISTLVSLWHAGKLSRPRLLDASLDGLHRDFEEVRANWFAALHERLSPTIDERAERTRRYLSLLHSRNGSTVSFALKALAVLQKGERLDGGALLENLRPALGQRTKVTVGAALKLLGRAALVDGLSERAAALAADALLHESPDVQRAAVDIIERHGRPKDATLRGLVEQRLSGLAASQRNRLAEWLQAGVPSEIEAPGRADSPELDGCLERIEALDAHFCELAGMPAVAAICQGSGGEISAVSLAPMDVPRLDPQQRIEPIADLDALLERFAVLLEDPSSPDEVERVLDGVSRLCGKPPADLQERIAPLQAQALELIRNLGRTEWFESVLRSSLAVLAVRWAVGPAPNGRDTAFGPAQLSGGVFQARLGGIVRRAARRRAAPLLSAPTHAGGWIDPRTLVARAQTWQTLGQLPDNLDRAFALLRLAPEHRSAALQHAHSIEGEFGEALRYALGGEVESIGSNEILWVAAARARTPFEDDKRVEERHPGLGADGGTAAGYRFHPGRRAEGQRMFNLYGALLERIPPVPERCPDNLPTVALHSPFTYVGGAGLHRWLGTIWPLARESFFAFGVDNIVGNERGQMDMRADRPFLEALFDPDVPLTRIGGLLLTGALSAKHAEESLLATDALIAAIGDGRLDRALLGKALARLLPTGLLKPNRVAKTLAAAAKISPLHAYVIAGGLQQGLQWVGGFLSTRMTWTGLAVVLRLLKELLIEVGEPVGPDLRAALSGLKTTANNAALIRQLSYLEENNSGSAANAAARYALIRRIERAERWSRCAEGERRTSPRDK